MCLPTGEDLTPEQRSKFKFVLDQPNRWLTLMQFLLDPPSITAFMAQNCGNHVVGEGSMNERVTAARWVRQDMASLPENQPLRLCTDKAAKAWKDFHLCVAADPPSPPPFVFLLGSFVSLVSPMNRYGGSPYSSDCGPFRLLVPYGRGTCHTVRLGSHTVVALR